MVSARLGQDVDNAIPSSTTPHSTRPESAARPRPCSRSHSATIILERRSVAPSSRIGLSFSEPTKVERERVGSDFSLQVPGNDSIQESNLQANFSPEYGPNSGSVIVGSINGVVVRAVTVPVDSELTESALNGGNRRGLDCGARTRATSLPKSRPFSGSSVTRR
jgi:hypothetical protein